MGVSRQPVHGWVGRYLAEGSRGLGDRSHRPTSCPRQVVAAVRWRCRGCGASIHAGVGSDSDGVAAPAGLCGRRRRSTGALLANVWCGSTSTAVSCRQPTARERRSAVILRMGTTSQCVHRTARVRNASSLIRSRRLQDSLARGHVACADASATSGCVSFAVEPCTFMVSGGGAAGRSAAMGHPRSACRHEMQQIQLDAYVSNRGEPLLFGLAPLFSGEVSAPDSCRAQAGRWCHVQSEAVLPPERGLVGGPAVSSARQNLKGLVAAARSVV
jgi:leucine-zipper of insertion element IS481